MPVPLRSKKDAVFWSQSNGLLLRSFHFQRRQVCSSICNFVLPALTLVLLSILSRVLTRPSKILPFEKNPLGAFAATPFELDQCKQLGRELRDANLVAERCAKDPFQTDFTVPFYAPSLSDNVLGFRTLQSRKSILGNWSAAPIVYSEVLPGGDFVENQTPYDGVAAQIISEGDTNDPTYKAVLAAEQNSQIDDSLKTSTKEFTGKAALLRDIFNIWYNGGSFASYYTVYGFNKVAPGTSNRSPSLDVTIYYNESTTANCTKACPVFYAVQHLDAAVYKSLTDGKSARAYLRRMPRTPGESDFEFLQLLISILLALLLHFFIPSFMGFLVYERQARLRELMGSMGLKSSTYWFGTYFSLLAQYGITAVVITIVGFLAKVPFFKDNSFVSYAVLFFLWGHIVVAYAVFFAPFFRSAETAIICGWLFVIVVNLVGGRYVGTLLSADSTSEGTWVAVMLLPSFALMRSVYYAGAFNTGGKGVVAGSQMFHGVQLGMCKGDGPFCKSYGFLIAEWIVLMLVGLYLEQVLSGASGIRRHPLFCFGFSYDKKRKVSGTAHSNSEDDEVPADVFSENSYVSELLSGDVSSTTGIIAENLQKVYGVSNPPVVALRGLSFAARQGEVTGFCGSNGAGKTTTFRILTGALTPSDGIAIVNGRSVFTDLPAIHRDMGVCFQQDILWDVLSVREHLYFVGRVRGVKREDLKGAVDAALASVDLTDAATRRSSACSGGMRRRLSVAMALLGSPSVVILDEPSSGLDPSTQERLWNAISNAKPGKTIIVTTHSMEEAQKLCDRVAMLSRGRLKAIGKPDDLKMRLGRGFRLSVSLPQSSVADLHDMMTEISPDARVETALAGTIVYSIPRSVALSRIFTEMTANKTRLRVQDWEVSQSTLEDVFLTIMQDEADVSEQKHFHKTEGVV